MSRAAVLAILFSGLALAAAEVREYPFVKTLHLCGMREPVAAIVIDTAMYRATRADYSNILIVDDAGKVVPFAVRDLHDTEVKTEYRELAGKITAFSRDLKNNTAVAELTLDKPGTVARLVFPADSVKFDKTVALEFFDQAGIKTGERRDLPLRQYGKIFGSAAVDFDPAAAAKIRIVINRYTERKESEFVTEAAIAADRAGIRTEAAGTTEHAVVRNVRNEEYRLKGIVAYQAVTGDVPGEIRTSPVELPEMRREEKKDLTEITVNANRVPCTGLTISADDGNYSRKIEIVGIADRRETALKVAEVTPKTGVIPLPGYRGKYYVVRIHNGGDAPLKNLRLKWSAIVKVLVFVPPAKGGDLTIYYGGNAPKRAYDIEKYADTLGPPHTMCIPGRERESRDYSPGWGPEAYKYLLWIVLAVVVLGLFITIIRYLAKSPDAA